MKRANKKKSSSHERFERGEEIAEVVEMPSPKVVVQDEDSIEQMFRSEQFANQNDVKELFHEEKVKARTDINARQIKLVTKAFYLAKLTGMHEINNILSDFLTLRISNDRKSRAEYVEGLKAKVDNALQNGMNIRGQFGK